MKKSILLCLALALASTAQAGLIVVNPTTDVTAYGFGANPALLSLQLTPLQQGCTVPTDTAGGFLRSCGDAGVGGVFGLDLTNPSLVSGNNKYSTPTLASRGVTSWAELALLLNINEPGSSVEVTLQLLRLTLYGGSLGTTDVFHFDLPAPIDLIGPPGGQGAAGFVITIDPAQYAGKTFDGNLRVGLAAKMGCTLETGCDVAGQYGTAGGDESFTLVKLGTQQPVPEPATAALLGGGLIALAWVLRRRKAS